MILTNRLTIPDDTQALLWDMDGVLIDSLIFDYRICNQIVQAHLGAHFTIEYHLIRELFPLDIETFWQKILHQIGAQEKWIRPFVTEYEIARQNTIFPLQPGIYELLSAARDRQILMAVVSNNPTQKIRDILSNIGLIQFFQIIVGNDIQQIAKKPAPDTYQLAAQLLGVKTDLCVVIEDSLIGAHAGHTAGCYTIGVATGADDFSELDNSPLVNCTYSSFSERRIEFIPGAVSEKNISTPNEFVSHMLEHIAWRLGCSVIVNWNNSDWEELGRTVGNYLGKFPRRANSAATIGMIDDGSAEIRLTCTPNGGLLIKAISQIDLDWFLASRCEQLANGQPLIKLLQGIALAFPLNIEITVCSFEDPHHTWEGIFRAFGIALQRIIITDVPPNATKKIENFAEAHAWKIIHESPQAVELSRTTAESIVKVALNFEHCAESQCNFQVANSINVYGLSNLLREFTQAAGCDLRLEFNSTRINSSHVVMEDTGMVIGRAVKAIILQRMQHWGVNGAGSSINQAEEIDQAPIALSLSIEGRKFWTFVPFYTTREQFRRDFIIGHTVRGLFSEDLDDFLDGFSGGISGSIMIHIRRPITPQEGWPLIFRALGQALAEALIPNPARLGVPPGVKATLA